MLNIQHSLSTISHPLVSSIFLKKDFGHDLSRYHEDVLVIEANFNHSNTSDESFSANLNTLFTDLPYIKTEAEERVGHFDRVDIRTH